MWRWCWTRLLLLLPILPSFPVPKVQALAGIQGTVPSYFEGPRALSSALRLALPS